MQKKFTLTATGQTDSIAISPSNILTFASIGDAADYTLDAQVKLTDDGSWIDAQADMADSTLYSTVSGARHVRFDLTALGTATSIDIEITGSDL